LKIGLPMPELLGPFVGTCEILGGSLVLLGLLTRLAVIPLLIIMTVALITTKWPMLGTHGFWHMAHEARTDWSMFLGSHFLLIAGAGPWSLDARLASRR
jgi:putative oxidoreductase